MAINVASQARNANRTKIGRTQYVQITNSPQYKQALAKQQELEKKITAKAEEFGKITPEMYAEEYAKLDSDIKGYFTEPTVLNEKIEAEKQKIVAEGTSKAQEQISKYEKKLIENKERVEKAQKYYRENRTDSNKQKLQDWINREELKLEKEREKYNYYLNKWKGEGLGKIKAGYDFNSVDNWIDSYVSYKVARDEYKDDYRKAVKEQEKALEEAKKSNKFFSVVEYDKSGKPVTQKIYTDGFKTELGKINLKGELPYNQIELPNMKIDFRKNEVKYEALKPNEIEGKKFNVMQEQGLNKGITSKIYDKLTSSRNNINLFNNINPLGTLASWEKTAGEKGNLAGTTIVVDSEGNQLAEKPYGWRPNENNPEDYFGKDQIYIKDEKDSKYDYFFKKNLPFGLEYIPIVAKDIVVDTGKGLTQAGFYLTDEVTNLANLKRNKETGKLYIPEGKDIVGKWNEDSIGGKIRKWSGYDWETNPFKSPEYQTAGMTVAFAGAGGIAGGTGKVAQVATQGVRAGTAGLIGYQGYQTLQDPTSRNVGTLTAMAILPELTKRGMRSFEVKQGYNSALKDLEMKFGKNSPQVNEFKSMWNRAFEELPRNIEINKKWSSAQVEQAWGDKKVQAITNEVMAKYKPEVIGSTTIKPQTTLKELPRKVAGDVDIQNVPYETWLGRRLPEFMKKGTAGKNMAFELAKRLREEGYNSDVHVTKDNLNAGKNAYHVRIDGKEFVNIHGSSDYFLKTQAEPLLNWHESSKYGAWNKDPAGIKMGNIRDQMRVKLWKGFVEKSRPKDIVDARGIYEGTMKYKKIPTSEYGMLGKGESSFSKGAINKIYKDSVLKGEYSLERMGGYSQYSGAYAPAGNQYYKNTREIYDPYTRNNYRQKIAPYIQEVYNPRTNKYEKVPTGNRKYNQLKKREIYDPYTFKYGSGDYSGYTGEPPKNYSLRIPLKIAIQPRQRRKIVPNSRRTKDAWQPIMYDNSGKYIEGDYFETYTGATNEGMIATDELPQTSFSVRKVKVPEALIKKARNARVQYKFQMKNGVFSERGRYRRDRPREGNFNWMGYLKASPSM